MKRPVVALGLVLAAAGLALAVMTAGGDGGRGSMDDARRSPAPSPTDASSDPTERPQLEREDATDSSATELVGGTPDAGRTRADPAPDTEWDAARHYLTGTIKDGSGPVVGANLELHDQEGQTIADGRSGSGGRFHLSIAGPRSGVWLRTESDKHAPLITGPYTFTNEGGQSAGVLRLGVGVAARGTVVDPNGKAVAGATVELRRGGRRSSIGRPLLTATTDAHGGFGFSRAPRGPVLLAASARGFGTTQAGPVDAPGKPTEIRLAKAHEMRLTVRDPRGNPIPNAAVTLESSDRSAPERVAHVDHNGRLVLDDLGAPRWEVRASAEGHRPGRSSKLEANGTEAVIELVPWPCLEGLVLDPDGSPAPPGTQVVAIPSSPNGNHQPRPELARHELDEKGGFRLCDLRPGFYVVRAEAPGYGPAASSPVRILLDTAPPPTRVILRRAAGIAVTLARNGEPVPQATVEVHGRAPLAHEIWISDWISAGKTGDVRGVTTSDNAGRAQVGSLEPGSVWLAIRADGCVPMSRGPFTVREGRLEELGAIPLEPAGTIRGKVVSSDAGRIVSGARVTLTGSGSGFDRLSLLTDRRGVFESPPLPAGRYHVRARRAAARKDGASDETDVEVRVDEQTDVVLEL